MLSSIGCEILLRAVCNYVLPEFSFFPGLLGLSFGYFPIDLVLKKQFKDQMEEDKKNFIRGAKKFKEGNIEDELLELSENESGKKNKGIKIWKDLKIPFSRETHHTLIVGSTGAGKTQIIYPMIDQLLKERR